MSPPRSLLSPSSSGAGAPGLLLGPIAVLVALAWACLAHLRLWSGRAAQREALAELDDRLLRDIGLTRREVLRESGKPPWRP